MSILYPDQIDNTTTIPPAIDNATPVSAVVVNILRDAILALENELGVVPAGIYGTVRARLDALEQTTSGSSGPAAGDLSGNYPNPTVIKIQGRPISATVPTDGYVLTWVSVRNDWEPQIPTAVSSGSRPVGPAGGDLGGNYPNPTVSSLTGNGGIIPIGAIISGQSTTNFPVSYGLSVIVMSSDGDYTLASNELINPIIRITSSVSLTATRNIILPTKTGALYYVYNNTSGSQSLTFKTAGGSGITVANGLKTSIYCDGTNYVITNILIGGDLLQSSSTSQTVIKINGATVPSGGSLVTGNILQVSGPGSLTYAPINLAGGSNFVTGTLPSANQVSQTMGGDLSGTTNSAVINAISGSSPINITPPTLEWLKTSSGPTLTQEPQTSDLATKNITIAPQAPFSGATTNVAPGSVIISLAAPISGSSEGSLTITRNGTNSVVLGPYPGAGTTFSALWLGPASTAPTGTNYSMAANSSTTYLQAPTNINMFIGSTEALSMSSTYLNYGGNALGDGGGNRIIGISDSLAQPTSAPVQGSFLYSSSGALETYASAFQFNKLQSNPKITQINLSSIAGAGANGQSLSIQSQPGQAVTGTSNNGGNGGDLVLSSGVGGTSGLGAPGNAGNVIIQTGGATNAKISPDLISLNTSELRLEYAIKTITGTVTITGPNVLSGTASTTTGSPIVTTTFDLSSILMQNSIIIFNNNGISYIVSNITSSSITLTVPYAETTGTYSLAVNLKEIAGTGTRFTSELRPGQSISFGNYSCPYTINSILSDTLLTLMEFCEDSGPVAGLKVNLLPQISVENAASDIPTSSLTIRGQSAYSGATTNKNGGNLILKPGLPTDSTGSGGSVQIWLDSIVNSPTLPQSKERDATFSIFNTENNSTQDVPFFSVAPYEKYYCRVTLGADIRCFIDGSSTLSLSSSLGVNIIVNNQNIVEYNSPGDINNVNYNIQLQTPINFSPSATNPVFSMTGSQNGYIPTGILKFKGQDANVSYQAYYVDMINGSPNVLGTINSEFVVQQYVGQTVSFSSQPGNNYVISTISDNTHLILTTNYTGPTETFVVMTCFTLGANANGGPNHIQGGSASNPGVVGLGGPVRLQTGADNTKTLVEVAEIALGQHVVALAQVGSGITNTQMPSGSGDGVVWIANAQTSPTTSPVGGSVLYSESGNAYVKSSSGYSQSIGSTRITRSFPSDANYTAIQSDFQARIMEFTGTISSTRNIFLPNINGYEWIIFNNTSGAQSINVMVAGQTGTTIANGKKAIVYCDGNDIVRATADI